MAPRRECLYEDQSKYEVPAVKHFDGFLGALKFVQSWLFDGVFVVFRGRRGALDLALEALGHLHVALRVRKLHAFLKQFDGARYVALAEQGPGFAEDARVALTFFGGIHEDY